ncbi:hypothetical protein LCGC14_2866910, partial [marine sediment metagenome]
MFLILHYSKVFLLNTNEIIKNSTRILKLRLWGKLAESTVYYKKINRLKIK